MDSNPANIDEAKEKWLKFKQVDELLRSVNEYMDVYRQMKESGQLKYVVGSSGEKEAMHEIPAPYDESTWNGFTEDEKLKKLMEQANQTQGALVSLTDEIEKGFKGECSIGPVKKEDRIKEKRDKDYEGEVRRVIDIVRCSFILSDGLESANKLVNAFQPEDNAGIFRDWDVVRVKDGFEKAENFIVGGYRDLKLNLRWKPTGHIVEVQLHLRPYYELKQNGGHHHYTFARSLDLQGVTDAVQILTAAELGTEHSSEAREAEMLKWLAVIQIAQADLEETDGRVDYTSDESLLLEKARVLRRIGELYSVDIVSNVTELPGDRVAHANEAIKKFEEARQLVEGLQDGLSENSSLEFSREVNQEHCLVLNKLSYLHVRKHILFDPEHNVRFMNGPYPFEDSLIERLGEQLNDGGELLKDMDDIVNALYRVFQLVQPSEEGHGLVVDDDLEVEFLDDAVNTSDKVVGPTHPFALSVKHTQLDYKYSTLFKFRNRLSKAHEMFDGAAYDEELPQLMKDAFASFLDDIDTRYEWNMEELIGGYRDVIEAQIDILGRGHPDVLQTQMDCCMALWNRESTSKKSRDDEWRGDGLSEKKAEYMTESYSLLVDATEDGFERLGPKHSLVKELLARLSKLMMSFLMFPDEYITPAHQTVHQKAVVLLFEKVGDEVSGYMNFSLI